MMSSFATLSENEMRTLIADDHPIIHEGFIAVLALEDDLKLVGWARDGEAVCLLYHQLCPDILILDLRIPKKDGLNDSGTFPSGLAGDEKLVPKSPS